MWCRMIKFPFGGIVSERGGVLVSKGSVLISLFY